MILHTDLLICNKFGFVVWGWVPGRWLNYQGGSLCVWRSPLHYLGYTLEWSLVFGARLCWGGGNLRFHGIYMVSRGNYFIIGVGYAPLGHLRMWRVQLS